MARNKYKVSPPDERRFNGRTYGSKAEMYYAQQLYKLREMGEVIEFVEQPRTWLGVPENVYVPDFFVVPKDGACYYVDVKGVETPKFKRDKKLWASYGRVDLVIVTCKNKKLRVGEVIYAASGDK